MSHPEATVVPARELKRDDVLINCGATVNVVDTTTTPGVVYVEVDFTYRLTFNHGDPVKIYRTQEAFA